MASAFLFPALLYLDKVASDNKIGVKLHPVLKWLLQAFEDQQLD